MNTLELMTDAVAFLSEFGEAELCYLTAELAPFSSGQRPDLIFRPLIQSTEQVFFVEYWPCLRTDHGQSLQDVLLEHRAFIADQVEGNLRFSYSTHEDEETVGAVHSPIKIFPSVNSGVQLGQLVYDWATSDSGCVKENGSY